MIAVYTSGPFQGLHFDDSQPILDTQWSELPTILRAHCMAFIAKTHRKSTASDYTDRGVTVYVDERQYELHGDAMLDIWERSWDWEYPLDEPDNPKMIYPFSECDLQTLTPVPDYQKDINLDDLIAELNDPRWEDFNDHDRNTMVFDLEIEEESPTPEERDIVARGVLAIDTKPAHPTRRKPPNLTGFLMQLGAKLKGG